MELLIIATMLAIAVLFDIALVNYFKDNPTDLIRIYPRIIFILILILGLLIVIVINLQH